MEFLDNDDCTNDFILAAYLIVTLDQHSGVLLYTLRVARTFF